MPETIAVLVKLRASAALRAAGPREDLRPLHDMEPVDTALGIQAADQWFLADLPVDGPTPWDIAHARLSGELGVAESDVLFAEPDIVHRDVYVDPTPVPPDQFMALGAKCEAKAQSGKNGRAVGPRDGWHLDDKYSQLATARSAVHFTDPRTRIGHIDTGYYPAHVTVPRYCRRDLERNFVARDRDPGSAADPNNWVLLLDNSGHGTGTLSILAGAAPTPADIDIGGAPDAEVVPLRIADSVVLLRTSAFAQAVRYAVNTGCDVVSMSMGGLPSEAWREEIDRAYLAGVCLVTAAGNNISGAPTRHVVYPARYGRVITACGVMADAKPYAGLKRLEMEGNYGPRKVMEYALAAYTPNIPWAVYPCPDVVRQDGSGTSAATPQIAAAAALWFEKYKNELPRDWRRVEAVRKALFTSAAPTTDRNRLGHGSLRAADALAVRPDLTRSQTKSDSDSFAFLRIITGLGLAAPTPRERMFNLEIEQRWLLNPELQKLAADPDDAVLDDKTLARFMEALIEDKDASLSLRRHVAARYSVVAGHKTPPPAPDSGIAAQRSLATEQQPVLLPPPHRRLRVYAVDPSFSGRLESAGINEIALRVRWEELEPGPAGEYVAVEDVDATGHRNEPVNLNDPRLLAQDGWAPSEGNAQFHQQMVYAVAMKTIEHFERALGRPLLWRHGTNPRKRADDSRFVKQLLIRPHALHQANAFYSPDDVALLFGYFDAGNTEPDGQMPGSRVYTCLSHDIIAHETTHAILDGMHRSFNEPSNPDVLAFHEAFADLIALLQHFTLPEVLENEIRRTRGDIELESTLGSLAIQFGIASGGRSALRDAIGRREDGEWQRIMPDPDALKRLLAPHSRGAILVAAVFDAFVLIYKSRIQDLLRLYTGGTGVLPAGAIHPDLVRRLSEEARKSAGHVLTMCIRALDYLPPVDITFFEYLRALITADADIVSDDRYNYRVAFVEAFRRRGIYPHDLSAPSADTVRTLSVDTLRWNGLDVSRGSSGKSVAEHYDVVVARLQEYANACFYLKDRKTLWERARDERRALHRELARAFKAEPAFARALGLEAGGRFEVHELRPSMRVTPDGRHVPQVIVAVTQSITVKADTARGVPRHVFRGGSTLVVDLSVPAIRYRIEKNLSSTRRRARTAEFVREASADRLRALFLAPDPREPFAALHALVEEP